MLLILSRLFFVLQNTRLNLYSGHGFTPIVPFLFPLPRSPKLSPDKGSSWLSIRITTSSHLSSAASTTSKSGMGHLGSRPSLIACVGERTRDWSHRRGASCGSSSQATRSWKDSDSGLNTPSSQVESLQLCLCRGCCYTVH